MHGSLPINRPFWNICAIWLILISLAMCGVIVLTFALLACGF
jgi:hypothetical protein